LLARASPQAAPSIMREARCWHHGSRVFLRDLASNDAVTPSSAARTARWWFTLPCSIRATCSSSSVELRPRASLPKSTFLTTVNPRHHGRAAIRLGRFNSQTRCVCQDNPKLPAVSNSDLRCCHHECLCHLSPLSWRIASGSVVRGPSLIFNPCRWCEGGRNTASSSHHRWSVRWLTPVIPSIPKIRPDSVAASSLPSVLRPSRLGDPSRRARAAVNRLSGGLGEGSSQDHSC
jgi:hypothetical protein